MTKQEIGAILMRLRENAGKSREEVADLLGKSVKTVGHWETGYAQPDANTLFLLCTIYDADLNTSFGFPPANKTPGTAEAAPGEDRISLEESNQLLVALGLIQEGQDLSDDDLAFLGNIISLLNVWFRKGNSK